MVRRHDQAVFMGGSYVFPGGVVDASDREAADPRWTHGLEQARRQLPLLDPIDAAAHHVAAVRELFEEAGVLLARDDTGHFAGVLPDRFAQHRRDIHAGTRPFHEVLEQERLKVASDALVPMAHWVTPPSVDTRRFDTRFFAARLPPGQVAAHDTHETTDSRWFTAAQAIATAERQAIILPPPTWVSLWEIAELSTVDRILEWAAARQITRREPRREMREGLRVLVMPHPDFAEARGGVETPFVWRHDRWLPL
jgi:8-oxo-dGTP pyrophosphatase MutT (NUDIX family)